MDPDDPIVLLDGQPAPPGLLTVNTGGGWGAMPEGRPVRAWEVRVHESLLLDLLDDLWEVLMDELRAGGEPCDLRTAGYPDLEDALDHPQLVADVLREWLDRDLLLGVMADDAAASWVVNATDDVAVDGEWFVLRGRCVQVRATVPASNRPP